MGSLNTILPGQSTNEFISPGDFEQLYLQVREKENRIYPDEVTANLPFIPSDHIYFKEWQIRAHSCKNLVRYLKTKNRKLNILEVGCGNGWLSARLADYVPGTVTGIDINSTELEQAKKVFGKKENLFFLQCHIHSELLQDKIFDIIVFAASVQYFPSLKLIIETAQQRLSHQGEIHILDSNFYKKSELKAAEKRTQKYFETLGFPEMANYYFHHCIDDLKKFSFEILFNPNAFLQKILRIKNPFYHIKIQPT